MKTKSLFPWPSLALTLAAAGAPMARAALYSQDFDVNDTANWTVNSGPGTNAANFFFDYSTVGIPSAPNSTGGSTIGMKLQANTTAPNPASLPGLSVSPTGQSFTGAYRVDFDMWFNYNGPLNGGGNGTTQAGGVGVRTAGTVAQIAGVADSVHFSVTLDGGSATDYRAYAPGVTSGYPDASPVFAAGAVAGNRNNSNAYYSSFGAQTAPVAQLSLFPNQTGSTAVGTIAFAWHRGSILYTGTTAAFSVDGKLIATVDTSAMAFGGNNILFNHYDTNNTVSTDPNAANLLFSLYDNVLVTQIPEPTGVALGALALALPWLRRRRS